MSETAYMYDPAIKGKLKATMVPGLYLFDRNNPPFATVGGKPKKVLAVKAETKGQPASLLVTDPMEDKREVVLLEKAQFVLFRVARAG